MAYEVKNNKRELEKRQMEIAVREDLKKCFLKSIMESNEEQVSSEVVRILSDEEIAFLRSALIGVYKKEKIDYRLSLDNVSDEVMRLTIEKAENTALTIALEMINQSKLAKRIFSKEYRFEQMNSIVFDDAAINKFANLLGISPSEITKAKINQLKESLIPLLNENDLSFTKRSYDVLVDEAINKIARMIMKKKKIEEQAVLSNLRSGLIENDDDAHGLIKSLGMCRGKGVQ